MLYFGGVALNSVSCSFVSSSFVKYQIVYPRLAKYVHYNDFLIDYGSCFMAYR